MKIPHLSASSGKTYDHCCFKFLVEYGLHLSKRISFKESYAASLGTHMHEVFEKIAKGKLTKDNWLAWSKKKQPTLYKLAKIKYPSCEVIADQVETDCINIFNCLFERDPVFNPLESRLKIIGIEHKFKIEVEGVPIKGFIDLIIELDKDTIEVYDYKTGSWSMGYREATKDLQVLMYFVAARHLFPQYKNILVTLDYLQKKPVTVALGEPHYKQAVRRLKSLWRKIGRDENPIRHKECCWVCRSFCDRKLCDKFWAIYLQCDDIDEFEACMEAYINGEI